MLCWLDVPALTVDVKGAASFVKKTVFGFSDSMTKFTSSVGKGIVSFRHRMCR